MHERSVRYWHALQSMEYGVYFVDVESEKADADSTTMYVQYVVRSCQTK